jgi:pimeloyl-ACP methyl ester carboxylesterase
MDRRTIIAVPFYLAATAVLARAQSLVGAGSGESPAAEEFLIPGGDPGVELYLRNKRAASGPGAPGRTVLLVHGLTYPGSAVFDLPLDGRSWMDVIAARGFDVWSVDIRGYGRSSRPDIFTRPADEAPPYLDAATATRDLEAAADFIRGHRGLDRISLVAWSWGSVLAARHAAEHPERVERLVLYAPVWQWQGPDPSPSAPPGAYRTVTPDAARQGWLRTVPEERQAEVLPDDWFQAWTNAVWASDPEGARMDPPALRVPNGPLVEVTEAWKSGQTFFDPERIEAPTLLVVAEWDGTTPPAQALALFPLLRNAPGRRLVVLPEGTHSIFLERNRDALFDTVQGFLEDKMS